MYKLILKAFVPAFLFLMATSCNQHSSGNGNKIDSVAVIHEENITIPAGDITEHAYVAYDSTVAGKLPVVIVVPEWWGLNDYAKGRAKQLAELGYLAIALDVYGDGKTGATPDEAMALAMPFYKDPQLAKSRLEAAITKAKGLPNADTAKIGAIGYCFGGSVVLNAARLGSPLAAVVSFHGGVLGALPVKGAMKAAVLICQGGADTLAPVKDLDVFKKQMDSVGAKYDIHIYPGAMHAFTNPQATEIGKKFNLAVAYNSAADTASWDAMKTFLSQKLK